MPQSCCLHPESLAFAPCWRSTACEQQGNHATIAQPSDVLPPWQPPVTSFIDVYHKRQQRPNASAAAKRAAMCAPPVTGGVHSGVQGEKHRIQPNTQAAARLLCQEAPDQQASVQNRPKVWSAAGTKCGPKVQDCQSCHLPGNMPQHTTPQSTAEPLRQLISSSGHAAGCVDTVAGNTHAHVLTQPAPPPAVQPAPADQCAQQDMSIGSCDITPQPTRSARPSMQSSARNAIRLSLQCGLGDSSWRLTGVEASSSRLLSSLQQELGKNLELDACTKDAEKSTIAALRPPTQLQEAGQQNAVMHSRAANTCSHVGGQQDPQCRHGASSAKQDSLRTKNQCEWDQPSTPGTARPTSEVDFSFYACDEHFQAGDALLTNASCARHSRGPAATAQPERGIVASLRRPDLACWTPSSSAVEDPPRSPSFANVPISPATPSHFLGGALPRTAKQARVQDQLSTPLADSSPHAVSARKSRGALPFHAKWRHQHSSSQEAVLGSPCHVSHLSCSPLKTIRQPSAPTSSPMQRFQNNTPGEQGRKGDSAVRTPSSSQSHAVHAPGRSTSWDSQDTLHVPHAADVWHDRPLEQALHQLEASLRVHEPRSKFTSRPSVRSRARSQQRPSSNRRIKFQGTPDRRSQRPSQQRTRTVPDPERGLPGCRAWSSQSPKRRSTGRGAGQKQAQMGDQGEVWPWADEPGVYQMSAAAVRQARIRADKALGRTNDSRQPPRSRYLSCSLLLSHCMYMSLVQESAR